MIIQDIVMILSLCRNIMVPSGLNKTKLEEILGVVKDDEINYLNQWNQLVMSQTIQNIISSNFPYHDYNDCLMYLKNLNLRLFPIPLSYIKSNQKEYIISYYYINNLNYQISNRIFNIEQLTVINQSSGGCITSAGPGTGKTTTACNKAYQLKDEGVIFVSYTNAAVKEDMDRMYEYPGSSTFTSKDLKKKIAFVTIDSLAGYINAGIAETHDHGIREAINKVSKSFYHFNYKHIIVDECQDIDDLRYELVASIYNRCGFKSITFFGDPRQKANEKAGGWYREMWINGRNITRVGFTISYRFKDLSICSLVNDLSKRRPELHHEMTCTQNQTFFEIKEPIIIYGNAMNGALDEIGKLIKKLHEVDKVPYSEFMIIGPSIFSETNNTSKFARLIASYFRGIGIPCKLSSEGSYERDGVLFSTIQSSKGKEADYIFIFGINAYPNNFNMIPYQEAESLIYIVHSRAKKKIFYIIEGDTIVLPRGIKDSHVKLMNINSISSTQVEKYPKESRKIVTELSKCFDFLELIKTNRCQILTQSNQLDIPELPNCNIDSAFFGTFIGMMIQMFCTNSLPRVIIEFLNSNYEEINDEEYKKLKYSGFFVNGAIINSNLERKLTIRKGFNHDYHGITIDRPIDSYSIDDFYRITKMLIELMSGERYELFDCLNYELIEYCFKISSFIICKYGNVVDTEVNVKYDNVVGAIDILTETHIIEIKTTREILNEGLLQCYLYKVLYTGHRNTVLINLRKKTEIVIESNRHKDYWRYIISKYLEIKDTVSLINYRHSNKTKLTNFDKNTFTIDTEFDMKSGNIFEIAIYNCNTPYKSIVQIVKSDKETFYFARSWIGISVDLYCDSPTINDIRDMFSELTRLYNDKPILYYYIADTDVKWSNISSNIDVSKVLSSICVKKGSFSSNFKVPKLIDYYNSHIDFHEFNTKAKHHTALTDALMVFEILKVLYSDI